MRPSPKQAKDSPLSTNVRRRLLVVEPDALTQWSLAVYLERWFDVVATDSAAEAARLLRERPVNALITSDDLPDAATESLESQACSMNADVLIVRTVTERCDHHSPVGHLARIEKPFDLASLARLLGVPAVEVSSD